MEEQPIDVPEMPITPLHSMPPPPIQIVPLLPLRRPPAVTIVAALLLLSSLHWCWLFLRDIQMITQELLTVNTVSISSFIGCLHLAFILFTSSFMVGLLRSRSWARKATLVLGIIYLCLFSICIITFFIIPISKSSPYAFYYLILPYFTASLATVILLKQRVVAEYFREQSLR